LVGICVCVTVNPRNDYLSNLTSTFDLDSHFRTFGYENCL